MKIELAKTEIIHFVGIGGIGMSGLALIMKRMGFNVQGSDVLANKNIERLKKDKIKITISHTKKNIAKATIVVISSAIKNNNPELIEAKLKQLPIYKRGEMFGKYSLFNKKYSCYRFTWKNNNNVSISLNIFKDKIGPNNY